MIQCKQTPKRLLAYIITAAMLLSLVTVLTLPANAATPCSTCGNPNDDCDDCGTFGTGNNLSWSLVGNKMTINGSGFMPNWSQTDVATDRPWNSHISDITTVIIGDLVTVIGRYSFYGQADLTSVTIGAGVTSVGQHAFSNTGLTSIVFKSETPPTSWGGTNNFSNVTTANIKITVPKDAKAKYEASTAFMEFDFLAANITEAIPLTFIDSAAYNIPASTVNTAITSINVLGGVSGGTEPYTFSAIGLPAGISISTAGVISGTPTTAGAAGTATITVTDSASPSATASITIDYDAISTASVPLTFTDNEAYDIPSSTVGTAITDINVFNGVSGGTPPYTFSAKGLPAGLTISAGGVISGTPTMESVASTATITVTDSASPSATASITINFSRIWASGVTRTVTVVGQVSTVTAGTGGAALFAVDTSGIDGGSQSVSVANLPTGVTAPATVSINDTNNTTTLSLTVGADVAAGTYSNLTLTIDGVTSDPFTLTISEAGGEDTTAPALTAGTPSRTSDTAATVKFTSNEEGTYYYQIDGTIPANAAALTDTGISGTMTVTENLITLTTLTAGARTVYIAGKDAANNVSNMLTITIPAFDSSSNNNPGDDNPGDNPGDDNPSDNPGNNPGGDNPGEDVNKSEQGQTGSKSAQQPDYGSSPKASEYWEFVRVDVNEIDSEATEAFNYEIFTGTDIVVPTKILNTVKDTQASLFMHTGEGMTFSISGENIPDQIPDDMTVNLTVRQGDINAPAALVNEKIEGTIDSRQIPMESHESFGGLVVNIHFGLGSENAGNYANLYYYNEETGSLDYLGSYLVGEDGQAMFGITSGADFLLTVTTEKPNEHIVGMGGEYIVRPGDNLFLIAAKHRISLLQLVALNPQISDINKIRPGLKIRIR